MNIRNVCIFKYPGQVEASNICFGQKDDGSIFINKWNVDGVEQPLESDLETEIPRYQRQFDVQVFKDNVSDKVENLLNEVAQSRNYDDWRSILTYVASLNETWQSESLAFSAWRDSVWDAVILKYNEIDSGFDIPDVDAFITSLPQIAWPS